MRPGGGTGARDGGRGVVRRTQVCTLPAEAIAQNGAIRRPVAFHAQETVSVFVEHPAKKHLGLG